MAPTVSSIVERLRRGEKTALSLSDWEKLSDLLEIRSRLNKFTPHSFDQFAQQFRESREYLGYLLHTLAGMGREIHRAPGGFDVEIANKALDAVLDLPPAERISWLERAAAVSESICELIWLLLIQFSQLGDDHWLVDPAWVSTAQSTDKRLPPKCLAMNVIAFSVHGANYRLTDEWVERVTTETVEGEPAVQFGWTDEDRDSIVWCDSRSALEKARQESSPSVIAVRSFATIPDFYLRRMLEAVVVFRRENEGWAWVSVNGLTREVWKKHLSDYGVPGDRIHTVETYYEDALRKHLLSRSIPATKPGDLLISLVFSVAPRALCKEARIAATIFAKVLLRGASISETSRKRYLHRLTQGLWQSVNQLKVPVLRRLTADVINRTHEKSERLTEQASQFQYLQTRLRELAQDASALDQRARELSLQIAGSKLDMELAYGRVAQLFDESYVLTNQFGVRISIRHTADKYSLEEARWMLCAALGDLLGCPRAAQPHAIAPEDDAATLHYLANAEFQLRLQLHTLFKRMRRGSWIADHIASLLIDFEDMAPELPEANDNAKAEQLQQQLTTNPKKALLRLKERFIDLGRRGRGGRDMEVHVLASYVPLKIGNAAYWGFPLWNTGAFSDPGAIIDFLRVLHEKMSGARMSKHSLRADMRQRYVLNKSHNHEGRTVWEFVLQGGGNLYLEQSFVETLQGHTDQLRNRRPAPKTKEGGERMCPLYDQSGTNGYSDVLGDARVRPEALNSTQGLEDHSHDRRSASELKGKGDTLGPFMDLISAMVPEVLGNVRVRFENGALVIKVEHPSKSREGCYMEIKTFPGKVEVCQFPAGPHIDEKGRS